MLYNAEGRDTQQCWRPLQCTQLTTVTMRSNAPHPPMLAFALWGGKPAGSANACKNACCRGLQVQQVHGPACMQLQDWPFHSCARCCCTSAKGGPRTASVYLHVGALALELCHAKGELHCRIGAKGQHGRHARFLALAVARRSILQGPCTAHTQRQIVGVRRPGALSGQAHTERELAVRASRIARLDARRMLSSRTQHD